MKHFMLDMYGVGIDIQSADKINEILNAVINVLSLKAVMPVMNFPYYYAEPAEEGGVSSVCLLDNGHITLHTFPFYGTCYADIMFSNIDEQMALKVFSEFFKPERFDEWCFDRDAGTCAAPYDENSFGPHLLVEAITDKKLGLEDIYEYLEILPEEIGMHNIMRPVVATNKIHNYTVISGLSVIAESHLSFHYNIESGKIYFDIYSCKFCDKEILFGIAKKLFGENCSVQLVSRGEKLKNPIMEGYILTDNGWKNNI